MTESQVPTQRPDVESVTIRDLLISHATSDAVALRSDGGTWSWREFVGDARRRSGALHAMLDPQRPRHVGLLMDNTPEMLLGLAAAGLGSHVAVGLNSTRRESALLADVLLSDVQVLLTDHTQAHLLEPLLPQLARAQITVIDTGSTEWSSRLSAAAPEPPANPQPDSLFMLIFTSGTSGRPKAVRITHDKITASGAVLADRLGLVGTDVHYVSMPLFHSNAVVAGWAPALVTGAAVALAERFSASGFLPDVRRFGATYANYVGAPLRYVLATGARDDDADNPLRLVFGNEAGERDVTEFARRFGVHVIDGFGSTENGVVVSRTPDTPPGSLGRPAPGVAVLDPDTGEQCPPGVVGELVNTAGNGQFAGYYNDDAATAERMRGGMYWSGDLAYCDDEGFVYFAGRTADWLRVDGENLAAAPVEALLLRCDAIAEAAVYAVPDPAQPGDLLVAALVLRDDLDADTFAAFLDAQPDLSPKARPRYVLVRDELPRTATHKVLKRQLSAAGIAQADWVRQERGTGYHRVEAARP